LSYIGAIERSNYNSRKLIYEYGLNRFFQLTGITTSTVFSSGNTNIFIQTNKVSTNNFIMFTGGTLSSIMHNNSFFSTAYMCNKPSFTNQNEYTIWIPNYIYTATTNAIVSSFADSVNLGGMMYSISGY
jgi:hypothetical protein